MKIAIIDDVKEDRSCLSDLVETYFQKRNIIFDIDTFPGGEEFFKAHSNILYDIVFLDIYMNGMSGMELAQKLREQQDNCHLIFVTTSTDCAVSSYDVRAVYYLMKPLEYEKLERALDLCCRRTNDNKYIEVVSNRLPTRILLNNFFYAETYQNAVTIHTTMGCIKTYMTFQSFLILLNEDPRFLVCYKGCVINMDHIRGTVDDCFIVSNKDRVPIRKRELNIIKKEYANYLLSHTTS